MLDLLSIQKTIPQSNMEATEDFSFMMDPTPSTPMEGTFCWSPDFSSPRDDWEHLNVFEYPPTGRVSGLTIGINSPGSTGSEVNTPTSWTGQDYEYSNDGIRLPPVSTAFSFSRNFCNNYYDEQNYQELPQDYQGMQFELNNEENFSVVQAVEEFDLSFIRGDPTNLFNEGQDGFSSGGDCYPVGHLVTEALDNYRIKEEIDEPNQLVVTQQDALLLEKCSNGAPSRKYSPEGIQGEISENVFKPYRCTVDGCGKRYTDPSSLRKHVKNHTETSSTPDKSVRKSVEGSFNQENNRRIYEGDSSTDRQFVGISGDWTKLEGIDESQPEFVPFESVARILGHDDSCIDGVGLDDGITDFQELSPEIERQFLDLNDLDDTDFA
nr:PREDICTED: uncharacterized protein LOC105271338 [Fopius arisanus]